MFKIFCAISLAFSSSLLASNPANPLLYVTQVPMADEINNRTEAAARHACAAAGAASDHRTMTASDDARAMTDFSKRLPPGVRE